jgi:hypothetical protein
MIIKGLDFLMNRNILVSGSPDYRLDLMKYNIQESL